MTVGIGLIHDGVAYVGADSAITDLSSGELTTIRTPKVFSFGDKIVGYGVWAGSVACASEIIDVVKEAKPLSIGCIELAIRKNRDRIFASGRGTTAIFAMEGELLLMDADLGFTSPYLEYDAIGLGASVALGAMAVTIDVTDPKRRIMMALTAAEQHNATCRGPFAVLPIS